MRLYREHSLLRRVLLPLLCAVLLLPSFSGPARAAEADGYLSPELADRAPLADIADGCDLCVPMKYALPGGRPCVGLLRAEGDHMARVRPLYYRAAKVGGCQGPWRIEWLSLE